jgi:hypothetical protein
MISPSLSLFSINGICLLILCSIQENEGGEIQQRNSKSIPNRYLLINHINISCSFFHDLAACRVLIAEQVSEFFVAKCKYCKQQIYTTKKENALYISIIKPCRLPILVFSIINLSWLISGKIQDEKKSTYDLPCKLEVFSIMIRPSGFRPRPTKPLQFLTDWKGIKTNTY